MSDSGGAPELRAVCATWARCPVTPTGSAPHYPASVQVSFRPPARTTDILALVVLSAVLSTCLSWLRPSSLTGTIYVNIRLKLG